MRTLIALVIHFYQFAHAVHCCLHEYQITEVIFTDHSAVLTVV